MENQKEYLYRLVLAQTCLWCQHKDEVLWSPPQLEQSGQPQNLPGHITLFIPGHITRFKYKCQLCGETSGYVEYHFYSDGYSSSRTVFITIKEYALIFNGNNTISFSKGKGIPRVDIPNVILPLHDQDSTLKKIQIYLLFS